MVKVTTVAQLTAAIAYPGLFELRNSGLIQTSYTKGRAWEILQSTQFCTTELRHYLSTHATPALRRYTKHLHVKTKTKITMFPVALREHPPMLLVIHTATQLNYFSKCVFVDLRRQRL